ncbi:MAG: acyltransferase family protein [Povalibacter sp.]
MQNSTKRRDFNIALNGYRGLCAMLVFTFHLGSAGIIAWPSGSLAEDAVGYVWKSLTYGVEMFFMISGFVILGSLLRHASTGSFLKDRFVRIFSAWVPALCAVTLVGFVLQTPPFTNLSVSGASALFVGNLFLLPPIVRFPMIHQVSWSLSYEWMFYFASAIALLLYRRNRPHQALFVAWLAIASIFIVLFPRALFFVTGVIVFTYRDWFAARSRWLKFPALSFLVFLVAWRATGAMMAHLNDTVIDFLIDGRWIAMLIAFIASIHLFASVTLNASRQTYFLCGSLFQFLGRISYSFYLWHAPIMSLIKRFGVPQVTEHFGAGAGLVAFAVGTLMLAIPVSWLSWWLFEVRVAALMRRAFTSQAEVGGTVRAV